jgi:hypothetical protein
VAGQKLVTVGRPDGAAVDLWWVSERHLLGLVPSGFAVMTLARLPGKFGWSAICLS